MKKSLKIGLITGASLFATAGARAGLTKLGVIPNRFDIEILCSGDGYINFKDEIEEYVGENCTCNLLDDSGLPTCKKCGCSCDDFISVTEHGGNICDNCGGVYGGDYKPIIYLYPTAKTEVRVRLGNPGNLSHTYPKYNSKEGRNVIAEPNGDLQDLETGRGLYALYWEGISYNKPDITEGFVVKGEDTISFLEEKLAILGLNEHEAEEFIVYWLPQMENNPYNLIRFETIDEQNEAMPLNITPSPDSIIRIMMDWKVLDEYVEITEQQLSIPERIGFVVVERGGSKLG